MASFLTYTSENCPRHHKLTHLTYFNAGAMGFKNEAEAAKSYNKDLQMVKQFAEEVGLPVGMYRKQCDKVVQSFDGFRAMCGNDQHECCAFDAKTVWKVLFRLHVSDLGIPL